MLAQTKQLLDAVRLGLFSVCTHIFKTHTFFVHVCKPATTTRYFTIHKWSLMSGFRVERMKSTYFDVRHGGAICCYSFFVKSEITKNSNRSVVLNNHTFW